MEICLLRDRWSSVDVLNRRKTSSEGEEGYRREKKSEGYGLLTCWLRSIGIVNWLNIERRWVIIIIIIIRFSGFCSGFSRRCGCSMMIFRRSRLIVKRCSVIDSSIGHLLDLISSLLYYQAEFECLRVRDRFWSRQELWFHPLFHNLILELLWQQFPRFHKSNPPNHERYDSLRWEIDEWPAKYTSIERWNWKCVYTCIYLIITESANIFE